MPILNIHSVGPCQPDHCLNGTTCNAQSTTSYTCTCPPGFTGNNCQMQTDDCVGVNCGNGTCVDGIESFHCVCSPRFTGMSCGTNINECETIGCVNGTWSMQLSVIVILAGLVHAVR